MRVYCVLGMHRSGTSCLAGTLEEAGLDIGDVARRGWGNAKGDREDLRIVSLHKDILEESGGSWSSPPRRVRWSGEHRRRRDDILRERAGDQAWGFKDPRTLLTLEGWLEAIPDMRIAGIFRHPAAVARSLQARDGFSIRQGLRLWSLYNERLLAASERCRFPIISFDLEPDTFREKLARLLEALGLPADGRSRFFDPDLRHEEGGEIELPDRVRELHAALEAAAL